MLHKDFRWCQAIVVTIVVLNLSNAARITCLNRIVGALVAIYRQWQLSHARASKLFLARQDRMVIVLLNAILFKDVRCGCNHAFELGLRIFRRSSEVLIVNALIVDGPLIIDIAVARSCGTLVRVESLPEALRLLHRLESAVMRLDTTCCLHIHHPHSVATVALVRHIGTSGIIYI